MDDFPVKLDLDPQSLIMIVKFLIHYKPKWLDFNPAYGKYNQEKDYFTQILSKRLKDLKVLFLVIAFLTMIM